MKYALIIQGTSGSGKSTVAREIARQQKAILLEHDMFIFGTQPHKPEGVEHFTIGNAMMWQAFQVALETDRPIIIEGVLTTFDKTINNINLEAYLSALSEAGYQTVRVALSCSYEKAAERMSERKNADGVVSAVPSETYTKLAEALQDSLPSDINTIDTEELGVSDVVGQVTTLIPSV